MRIFLSFIQSLAQQYTINAIAVNLRYIQFQGEIIIFIISSLNQHQVEILQSKISGSVLQ
jgi:hypothetical protein